MDEAQRKRISFGNSKVQIDELKKLLKEASLQGKYFIELDFVLLQETIDWLWDNEYSCEYLENLYIQKPSGWRPHKIRIKISW